MSRLPSAYQKVEYLQGSGVTASPTGPYINTSYKAVSENYKIKSKFTVANLVHNTVLFGGGSSTDIISVLMTSESQLKFYAGSGSVSEALTSFAVGTEYEMECTANNGNLTVTLNGTSRSGAYSGAINKDYPLFIFANNSSGSAGQYSSLKVYWFQIYDNGILVRDFVPCYRKSDNTAGLYDTVNGEFYTNAGTDAFAIGPEISEPVVVTGGLMPLSFALRRRLFREAASALADFSLIVDGTEYKPGDTVTILSSTTVTVKGTGTAKVTLIGGGGGGGGYVGDLSENYNYGGDGGDGGTSSFITELVSGSYAVTIGSGGSGGYSGVDGGSTYAFGHNANGGEGGEYADDWGDGASGSNGTGETMSGNNTAYGQGGNGHNVFGGNGTDGACIIRILDPNAKTRTITLSGTFSISYSYAIINGEKITAVGTYEALDGDVITLALMAPSSLGTGGKVTVDGVTVITATRTLQTYDHTITSDCTITGSTSGSSYMLKYEIALVTT